MISHRFSSKTQHLTVFRVGTVFTATLQLEARGADVIRVEAGEPGGRREA